MVSFFHYWDVRSWLMVRLRARGGGHYEYGWTHEQVEQNPAGLGTTTHRGAVNQIRVGGLNSPSSLEPAARAGGARLAER